MTVQELNQNELDELKSAFFYSDDFTGGITGENDLPVLFPGDIPNRVIFEAFAGVDFVKDDFFCNINK